MVQRFRYSKWDGTQKGFELDAYDVFSEMTDELLYHGDVNSALRKMLQQGFEDRNGERIQGLRDMLENLRRAREERLEQYDLGGVYDEIRDALEEVVDMERNTLQDRIEQARQQAENASPDSADKRNADLAESSAMDKQFNLDTMPSDLASQVQQLGDHDFENPEARQRFEEFMEQLREQLMQQYLDQMSGAVNDMSPEDMQRMKDMMAELNNMLEQREAGEEPDFDGFMDKFGDFFPENPRTLDELLEIMAQRMAAARAMLNSMTPEQRAQLQALSEQLMEDMDLAFQASQLSQNLMNAFPDMNWGQSYDFSGQDPVGMSQAQAMMQELGDIDQLENLLRGATNPGALAEADIDKARDLLGDDAANSLERLGELARMLEEAGLIENKEGKLELTPKGMRKIGQNALDELFRKLAQDKIGKHQLERTGIGVEREYSTKPYEWGDPFNLHIERTVRNAITRTGGGTPVRLEPQDFEVERTEHLTRSSTVLMLDLSLSMPMRDNFLPAKKVAMALHSLITSQFPKDFMGIVGFSEVARVLQAHELPEVSWDFVYGTNMQHAFLLSRQMLARQSGTKQIIMITDGEPTAHIDERGQPFFSYPPIQETVDATLTEVARCTREGIRINTFMLDPNSYLRSFIEKVSRMNGGRAFFTTPDNLGDYVLVDFIEQRRKLVSTPR
ncbi:MAG: hypothetical protein GY713_01795 [Actinomycetia bacterium]|nr:hypothetical protein [Actinomycetes bacterium]